VLTAVLIGVAGVGEFETGKISEDTLLAYALVVK
jgi:hypothetical protein